MARADLLALTVDDLVTLTNRGIVKRATREIEAGDISCEFDEGDGELRASWSDGTTCRFPSDASLQDAQCSSGATGISRHVVRSVLAYQRHMTNEDASPSDSPDGDMIAEPQAETANIESWDPGRITDAQLESAFRKAAVTRARKKFEQGVLVELIRGPKPLARFLHEPCTVRFLVPGDLRYIHADCAENLLATYVSMAVWSFQQLDEDKDAGLVTVGTESPAVPVDVLDDIESVLSELCEFGLSGASSSWQARVQRLQGRARSAGLVWPADILADLDEQFERYHAHDARFDPNTVAACVGELLVRGDAIRNDTGAVPQLLIRGSKSDQPLDIRSSRFIGLGCGINVQKSSTRLTSFMQDVSTGTVLGIQHEHADPEGADPHDFHKLGGLSIRRGMSMHSLGAGQLLLKSAKRTPNHRLVLPRGHVSINPQSYEWEKLRAPVLVEDFGEVSGRLESLPPAPLRPRRVTEDLHVCQIESVEGVSFDTAQQALRAILKGRRGNLAELCHPFTSRGRQGFEKLAAELENSKKRLRFVSGRFHGSRGQLRVHAVACVFETRGNRTAIQPWTESHQGDSAELSVGDEASIESPITVLQARLESLIAEMTLMGLRQLDAASIANCGELGQQFEAAGFTRIPTVISRLHDLLAQKQQQRRWTASVKATQNLKCLAMLHLLLASAID